MLSMMLWEIVLYQTRICLKKQAAAHRGQLHSEVSPVRTGRPPTRITAIILSGSGCIRSGEEILEGALRTDTRGGEDGGSDSEGPDEQ